MIWQGNILYTLFCAYSNKIFTLFFKGRLKKKDKKIFPCFCSRDPGLGGEESIYIQQLGNPKCSTTELLFLSLAEAETANTIFPHLCVPQYPTDKLWGKGVLYMVTYGILLLFHFFCSSDCTVV